MKYSTLSIESPSSHAIVWLIWFSQNFQLYLNFPTFLSFIQLSQFIFWTDDTLSFILKICRELVEGQILLLVLTT